MNLIVDKSKRRYSKRHKFTSPRTTRLGNCVIRRRIKPTYAKPYSTYSAIWR
jgi:hypothetical protein